MFEKIKEMFDSDKEETNVNKLSEEEELYIRKLEEKEELEQELSEWEEYEEEVKVLLPFEEKEKLELELDLLRVKRRIAYIKIHEKREKKGSSPELDKIQRKLTDEIKKKKEEVEESRKEAPTSAGDNSATPMSSTDDGEHNNSDKSINKSEDIIPPNKREPWDQDTNRIWEVACLQVRKFVKQREQVTLCKRSSKYAGVIQKGTGRWLVKGVFWRNSKDNVTRFSCPVEKRDQGVAKGYSAGVPEFEELSE